MHVLQGQLCWIPCLEKQSSELQSCTRMSCCTVIGPRPSSLQRARASFWTPSGAKIGRRVGGVGRGGRVEGDGSSEIKLELSFWHFRRCAVRLMILALTIPLVLAAVCWFNGCNACPFSSELCTLRILARRAAFYEPEAGDNQTSRELSQHGWHYQLVRKFTGICPGNERILHTSVAVTGRLITRLQDP